MKIDKPKEINRLIRQANNALYHFESNNLEKLSKMAMVCELLYEDIKNDTNNLYSKYRNVEFDYMMNTYETDYCLVLQIDNKVYAYTRHDIMSRCRAEEFHSDKAPEKYIPLRDFTREMIDAHILYFIGLEFIGTPFIQSDNPSTDSKKPYTEYHYNKNKEKIEVTLIESLVLNIYSEFAVSRIGKVGWQKQKVIMPFADSYEKILGKKIFENIKAQGSKLDEWQNTKIISKDHSKILNRD